MVHRWDNKVGFVGGFVDENENLVEAGLREIEEEAGVIATKESMVKVCEHKLDWGNVHLFKIDLGKVPLNQLTMLVRNAANAKHAIAEGNVLDRKSTRLNSSHIQKSRMPSSA